MHFINGNDCFVSLHTGHGKSLFYGILPYIFDALRGTEGSIVLYVSPPTCVTYDLSERHLIIIMRLHR